MATTTDPQDCAGAGVLELLPQSAFTALHYHYGMLLGEEDFRTEQSYHKAKSVLHNAWCHGPGVLWGFGVGLDLERGEVRVRPGLALDGAGRELHLDVESCVNVAARMPSLLEEAGVPLDEEQTEVEFDAHVTARFRACLARQVPAISEPCDGARRDTAYSRVHETIELRLVHGPAPERAPRYPRLALWFGLREARTDEGLVVAEDEEVLGERAHVDSLPAEERAPARAAAVRRLAALDTVDLRPYVDAETGAEGLVPAALDEPIPLADLRGLALERRDGNWTLVGGAVELDHRPSLLATSELQDWIAGVPSELSDALERGPRIVESSVEVEAQAIVFEADADLAEASIGADALSVSEFGASGWTALGIASAGLDGDPRRVRIELDAPLTGDPLRLIAKGTGPAPILGTNLIPLAGSTSSPPATSHDGHDFVFIHRS